MKKDSKVRLFEVMSRLDKTFKPVLNEWNFDKKKDDDSDDKDEKEEKDEKPEGKTQFNFEKKEDKETEKHEDSETPKEEKEEHEDKEELKEEDAPKAKIPVNAIAKVGGKINEEKGKQRLFENMKRVSSNFTGKALKEGYYDDDDDDQDSGHTVNGKLLSPAEYRKWKEEEGEYDDMDRKRKW